MTDVHPGQLALDDALERVKAGAQTEWLATAYGHVRWLAGLGQDFTTDQVWQLLGGDAPREPRAMGPVMLRAIKNGLVVATGRYRKSDRPECHRNPKAVYRGV